MLAWLVADREFLCRCSHWRSSRPLLLRFWYERVGSSSLLAPSLHLRDAPDPGAGAGITFTGKPITWKGRTVRAVIITGWRSAAQEIQADIAILDDDLDFRNYLDDFLKDEGMYAAEAFARPAELFEGCEDHSPTSSCWI